MNSSGKVSVIVDGKQTILSLDDNGNASLDLKDLEPGNHTVVVVYDQDNTYKSAHSIFNLNIPGKLPVNPINSNFDDIVVWDNFTVTMILKDENGNVIDNVPIKYSVNDALGNAESDAKGLVAIPAKSGAVINVVFEGNDEWDGTNITLKLHNPVTPSVVEVSTHFNISGGVITVEGYAVDTAAGEEGIYFATQLLDASGNPLKGVPIQFAVNNKIYDRVTLDDGSFTPYKLNMVRAGRYTMAFYFKGDNQSLPAFAAVCVDLDKKPITIKASDKTYAASANKKYEVTLSTIVGSSHDGKVHLSPKKVTLTINEKTYSAKTDNNGKATFNIKLTKKGKYTATIYYEGDNTYQEQTKSVKITVK